MIGSQPQQQHRQSDDKSSRVGGQFQADIPDLVAFAPAPAYYEAEKAIKVWSPSNNIPDHILEEFISKAKEKHFYNTEQSLGMLCWHKFDLNRAYADLPNFMPYPNEWSVEDKVLFEQAYQFYEKQFHKIKAMLPDKSMSSIINYYYGWKKRRTRASLMERQTKRLAASQAANSDEDDDEDEDKDDEDDEENKNQSEPHQTIAQDGDQIDCCACNRSLRSQGEPAGVLVDGVIENFCFDCYVDWRKSGRRVALDVETGDCFYRPSGESRKILFTYNDVKFLVEGTPEDGDLMLKHLDAQVQDGRREIQTKKQKLSQINEKIKPLADQIAISSFDEFANILPEYNPVDTWTQEDTQLTIQGFRRYGTDFSAISDVVRTKSPEAIKLFYAKHAQRLGLDALVNEHKLASEPTNIS